MDGKKCFRCGAVKPMDDFYRHPGMADGRLNKCKECTKSDVRRNYGENRESYRKYEQGRAQDPVRKAKCLEYQRNRRRRNPEKYAARAAVGRAIANGELSRKPCEVCGHDTVEAHHDDYLRPLDVRWLCFACHRSEHGQEAENYK